MLKIRQTAIALLLMLASVAAYSQTDLQRAVAAIESEKYAEARNILSKLASSDPTNPEVFYQYGRAYLGDEMYAQAKEQFQKGIKAKSKYPFNHVGLGQILLHEKKEEDAKIEFEKAQDFNKTNDVNVWLAIGYAYFDNGRKYGIDAEKIFTRAEVIAPTNPKPYIALGDMYMRSGILPSAMTKYTKATELDPKFAEGYYKLGLLKLSEGKELYRKNKTEEGTAAYLKALDFLKKATETNPDFAPAYREMGDGYYNAGNYPQAREQYQKYLRLAGSDLRARTKYVNALYLCGYCGEALPEIKACLKDTTTNVLLRLAAYCNVESGNFKEAQEYFDKYFARISPEYVIADDYSNLAKMSLKQGNMEKALEQYLKVLDKDSSKYKVLTAFVDSAANRKSRASTAGNDEDKRKYAAEEVKYRKLYIERKALAGEEKGASDYFRLGQAYYQAGDFENAEKTFMEVSKMSENYLPTYYWLGFIGAKKEAKGEKDAAKPFHEKIVAILKDKAVDKMEAYEKSYLASACVYLAYNAGTAGEVEKFNCEAAKPFIDRGLEADPNEANLKQYAEGCKQ